MKCRWEVQENLMKKGPQVADITCLTEHDTTMLFLHAIGGFKPGPINGLETIEHEVFLPKGRARTYLSSCSLSAH